MTIKLVIYYILLISKNISRLIATDLSKQTKLKDPQKLISLEKFKKILEQQCFSL